MCEISTHCKLAGKGGHAVWSLYWNGLSPFALAPFAEGVEVGNLAYYLSQSDLLTKVIARIQRQYRMYHTKQKIF